MSPELIKVLGKLPQRQLNLLLAGVILCMAALLSMALRTPFMTLRAMHVERAQLAGRATDGAKVAQQTLQLTAQIADTERALEQLDVSQRPDQLLVELLSEVDRAATRHGVSLRGVVPAPSRRALNLEELPFDLEARGRYSALAAWMADIESTLPGLSIVRFELQPGLKGAPLQMKLRIAAYRSTAITP